MEKKWFLFIKDVLVASLVYVFELIVLLDLVVPLIVNLDRELKTNQLGLLAVVLLVTILVYSLSSSSIASNFVASTLGGLMVVSLFGAYIAVIVAQALDLGRKTHIGLLIITITIAGAVVFFASANLVFLNLFLFAEWTLITEIIHSQRR